MKPLSPEELSAYLDGELSPNRMREVESILASDARAREELQTLLAADAKWRAFARSAAFHPSVELHGVSEGVISVPAVAAFVALLVIMQFALERLDVLVLTLGLNGVAFAIVLIRLIAILKSKELFRQTQTLSK